MLVSPTAARAQACDASVQARLEFLESHLDEGRTHAKWWWRSWLGIFVFGALVQSANAGWEENKSERANDYMSVAKSLLGVADLSLRPLPGRHGADRMREIPTDTSDGCARRLHLAESVMKEAAERALWQRELTGSTTSAEIRYRLVGDTLELRPKPLGAYSIGFRYIPRAPVLVTGAPGAGEASSIDGYSGFHQWIIYTVAIAL